MDTGIPTLELLSTMQTIGSVADIQRSAVWSLEVVVVGGIIDIRSLGRAEPSLSSVTFNTVSLHSR